MKILILADSNSIHTVRWIRALSSAGNQIRLFSFYAAERNLYAEIEDFKIESLNLCPKIRLQPESRLLKLNYLKAYTRVKCIIKEFKPDILHAHYASSYGLLGALSLFHPFVISVWGEDIFNFPRISSLHSATIKYNLSKADRILSTSEIMKIETMRYTSKEIIVTPFGIDIVKFCPKKGKGLFKETDIIIGTIKALEIKYGIECLINAFSIVKKKYPDKSLKLLLVGKGTQESSLKELVNQLKLEKDTIFTGYISHENIPYYQNILDISVSVSIDNSESFGVAILEASACGKPVIVSDVGGLPEVVEDGKTGFVVESKNPEMIADAISKLIEDPELRIELGKNGRDRVTEFYDWNDSVNRMISIYQSLLN